MEQLLRFGFVGIASNGVLYVFYLAMTNQAIDHKVAMTIAYVLGVIQTFVLNKKWSFEDKGSGPKSFLRYVWVYVLIYVFGLSFLAILVDVIGFPHQIVQGINIIVCGVLSFALQKYWVFNQPVLARK